MTGSNDMSSEKKHQDLDRLQNWKRKLCEVSEGMACNGEIVLHEHIESVISDLNYQMAEIVEGGAIVTFKK